MPNFRYRARDGDGNLIQGTLESSSESAVAARISDMGYHPVDISQVGGHGGFLKPRARKVPIGEVVIFYRQMATMNDAGLPLIYSLNTLAEGTVNRRFRQVVESVRMSVESGETLSDAIARHPGAFDEVAINMIRVGEASGNLSEVLERLAEFGERTAEIRSRVKNAMAYPIVLSILALGVVVFSLVVVMPRFARIFEKMNAPLPLPTRILMSVSSVVRNQWWLLLGAIVLAAVIFRLFLKTGRGSWAWDGFLFRLPVFGPLRLKNLSARFSRNMGTLIESGVDILFSFEVCERTLTSVRLEKALRITRDSVREGESIAPVLEAQHVFPPLLHRMIAVGEETGRLGQMLFRLAGYYHLEVEMTIKRLTTLLEPFMIIIMAAVVAFVAGATLLPLFNIIKYMH